MIGCLDKVYTRPIMVDEEELRYLSEIVVERFEDVEYVIHTIDGASYRLPTIDEVLKYRNPDARQIVKIDIRAEKNKENHGFYPSFSISLFDRTQHDLSCMLSLKDIDEAEITFLDQRVNEFVKKNQISYWWMHSFVFYLIVSILMYVGVLAVYNLNIRNGVWTAESKNSGILLCWSFVCMFASFFVVKKAVNGMFIRGGFAIGEQKENVLKKERRRYFLFVTVMLALLIGVVSGIIVNYISM